jgi:hypothetical protein
MTMPNMMSNNIIRQNQYTTQNLTTNFGFASNRDEAMMMNVPKGFTFYIFDMFNPIFYVKQVDGQTEQVTFKEYQYTEVEAPQKPVSVPAGDVVTKDDFESFKTDMMNLINSALTSNKSTSSNKSSRKGANSDEQ